MTLKKRKSIGVIMANRNKSYDEVLAQKFENLDYAKGYILNMTENEGLDVKDALRETIKAMGLQNFSEKSGLSIQAVSDFVSERQNWSTEKLKKHIYEVFKLKAKLSLFDDTAAA